MAVSHDEHGVEHVFAPNPKMQGGVWEQEYPPIQSNAQWLVNKFTGEIFPNTPDFAYRSDILEPYLGELPPDGFVGGGTVSQVNEALAAGNEIETL